MPAYVQLNGRLDWNVTDRRRGASSGLNLRHGPYQEFIRPNAVRRSRLAELRWRA